MHLGSNVALVFRVISIAFLLSACGSGASPQVDGGGRNGDGSGGAVGDGATTGDGRTDLPAGNAPPAEECARRQCNASVADLCCPAACSGATDIDCAGCGNGRLEAGEVCDPPERCASSCPQLKCERQRIKSEGTCAAVCVSAGTQTRCVDGDECCPDGCTAANDADCTSRCGNGIVEPGEVCDPLASCVQGCPMQGCTKLELRNPGTCTAHCVPAGNETMCRHDDGCCPAGCTAANDRDCSIVCGNGTIEGMETCDPLSSCPRECPAMGCRLRRLLNPGMCTAVCVDAGLETECKNGDGCCPPACNANNDRDCAPRCGNTVVESGETCDPISSCTARETACVSDATTLRTRMGDPGRCMFTCVEMTRTCGAMDRACPPGCGPTQDPDCAGCGNNVVEPNETCDPPSACRQQQAACVSDQSTIRQPGGDATMCTFFCRETPRACGPADMACPTGCTAARDPDCVGCGNGTLDPGETCDPVSVCNERSTACVSTRDIVRERTGDAANCRFVCRETPRMCGVVDGECPSMNCGPTQDRDCPGCGNLRVETGETCDPCDPADVRACVPDENTIRTPSGDPARCTFACATMARPCSLTSDGFCPTMCTRATDSDCLAGPGEPCRATSECAMGSCTDSRCCVQSCQTCQSCTGAQGTCANIGRGLEDNVPAGACAGGSTCNGMGMCLAPPCQARITPTSIDFGQVMVGSSSSRTVTVTNPCNMPITSLMVTSDSGEFRVGNNGACLDAAGAPVSTLAAGASCTVSLLFTPRAEGMRTATLSVAATGATTATAPMTGTGLPRSAILLFKPATVSFPDTQVGGASSDSTLLHNIGNADSGTISLGVINSPPGDAPFAIGQHGCTNLPPNGMCTVALLFRPRTAGPARGVLEAKSASGASDNAALGGFASAISFSPPSHSYGNVPLNTRAVAATFKLLSSMPLTGLTYAITGTNVNDFRMGEATCPAGGAIGPTSSCAVTVFFAPSSVGAKSAQLRVSAFESAAPTARRHEGIAPLSGTGIILGITTPPPVVGPPTVVQ